MGCHLMVGAMDDNPFLDVELLRNPNTEVALFPPILLDLCSKIIPKLIRLLSDTPVKTSKVEVKKFCLGMSAFTPLNLDLFSV